MMWKEVWLDSGAVEASRTRTVLSNRGFHALFTYRIANWLWRHHVPIIPLVITRVIQVLYAIDIDWRAQISGGCLIVHGAGVVIGSGAVIGNHVKIYHGVTLGIKDDGSSEDGFPHIGDHVIIGCGAKLLGPISVGNHAKIGANAVVIRHVPATHNAVGIPAKNIPQIQNNLHGSNGE